MRDREPALLVVLIETVSLRWHAAAIGVGGRVIPLLRSDTGNLSQYRGLEPDAQLSFLRHRVAGVLQRGCDRLYPKGMKVNHFLLIADGDYPNAAEGMTSGLANHFVEWMMNPPVTYLVHRGGFTHQPGAGELEDLITIAGDFPDQIALALQASWAEIIELVAQPGRWELIAKPPQPTG